MKVLFAALLSLLFLTNLHSQKLNEKYSFSESDYYDYEKKEKHPSKCDCDFIENTLILKKDSTFQLTEQVGRLDPEITIIKGTWKINRDSTLHLTGKYTEGIISDTQWSDSFIIRNSTLNGGHIYKYGIWDGTHVWNGNGEELFPKKK